MTERAPERKRRERSDKGETRLTARDLTALRWIAEQYGARADVVAALLGQLAGRAEPLADPTFRPLLRRWRDAGWVETRRVLVGEPGWIWPSRAGLRLIGLEYDKETGEGYRYWEPNNLNTLAHLHAVNRVRLMVEAKHKGATWASERMIAKAEDGKEGDRAHRPDAELFAQNGARVAIEVELSAKTKERTRGIMAELAGRYVEVWYYTAPQAQTVVQAAYGELPEAVRAKVKPYRYNQ